MPSITALFNQKHNLNLNFITSRPTARIKTHYQTGFKTRRRLLLHALVTLCLRLNVHNIHPKFCVILVFSILFRADRVDSMHIGTQGITHGHVIFVHALSRLNAVIQNTESNHHSGKSSLQEWPQCWCDLIASTPWAHASNAAFTCYRNYRKYEFPNRKLDVNGFSSRIYYWEIRK